MTGNGDPYENKVREGTKALRGAKGSGTYCGRWESRALEKGQEAREGPYCTAPKKPGEKINK